MMPHCVLDHYAAMWPFGWLSVLIPSSFQSWHDVLWGWIKSVRIIIVKAIIHKLKAQTFLHWGKSHYWSTSWCISENELINNLWTKEFISSNLLNPSAIIVISWDSWSFPSQTETHYSYIRGSLQPVTLANFLLISGNLKDVSHAAS